MRKVVAFLGVQGSGKSYNAKKLVKDFGYVKLSFADALREMAFKVLGMDFNEGMSKYDELKRTEIYNGQNFRNILENLGSAVREYSEDFWANVIINKIDSTDCNICIDDMRYINEYFIVYNYCKLNNIEFKAYFCNYRSDVYTTDNPHESAKLANFLYSANYKDLQAIDVVDMEMYRQANSKNLLKDKLRKALKKNV